MGIVGLVDTRYTVSTPVTPVTPVTMFTCSRPGSHRFQSDDSFSHICGCGSVSGLRGQAGAGPEGLAWYPVLQYSKSPISRVGMKSERHTPRCPRTPSSAGGTVTVASSWVSWEIGSITESYLKELTVACGSLIGCNHPNVRMPDTGVQLRLGLKLEKRKGLPHQPSRSMVYLAQRCAPRSPASTLDTPPYSAEVKGHPSCHKSSIASFITSNSLVFCGWCAKKRNLLIYNTFAQQSLEIDCGFALGLCLDAAT